MDAKIQTRVVALGLKQPDVGDVHDPAPLALADEHTFQRPTRRAARALPHSIERRREAFRRHRLHQVIERVHLERPDRVLVERRGEDHEGHPIEPLEQIEAAAARHLDVEEQQIDKLPLQARFRFFHIARLGHDRDVGVRGKQPPQLAARQPFVVGDERVHAVASAAAGGRSETRDAVGAFAGSESAATTVLLSRAVRVSDADAP